METVEIIKGKTDYNYCHILVTHDETGSANELVLSKDCYLQLKELIVNDMMPDFVTWQHETYKVQKPIIVKGGYIYVERKGNISEVPLHETTPLK